MQRISRERLRWLIWSALRFPPKLDQKIVDKLGVRESHAAIDRLAERVCDHVDNGRYGVFDLTGDQWMQPKPGKLDRDDGG